MSEQTKGAETRDRELIAGGERFSVRPGGLVVRWVDSSMQGQVPYVVSTLTAKAVRALAAAEDRIPTRDALVRAAEDYIASGISADVTDRERLLCTEAVRRFVDFLDGRLNPGAAEVSDAA